MYLSGGVLLALVAAVLSAPSGGKQLSIGLNVHRKLDTLERFQEHFSSLQANKGKGVVPMNSDADLIYYGEVALGTPGQKLKVLFDLHTADLIVPSYKICKNQRGFCKSHKVYNERKSKTYKKVGTEWGNDDPLYFAAGYTSNDTLQIGGLQVKDQMFGEATEAVLLVGAPFDGILGLAFSSVSQVKINPVFNNMIQQKIVDQPVFAFFINKKGEKTGSELVLGGVNPDHYTGEITYTPVIEQKRWTINIDGLTLKSKKIAGKYPATIDTRCGILYGPSEFMDKINKALGGEKQWDGSYSVDCDKISSFPDAAFTIEGKPFVLTPEEYTIKWKTDQGVVCYSQFYGFDDLTHFVLGEIFMRKFYSVFDVGQNRVGFATAK